MPSPHRVTQVQDSHEARATFARALCPFERSSRRGVTLLEVCCVVVIIGVVAAIALPRFADSNTQYRVETAARRLQSDIQFAQDQSRALSMAHDVIFREGSAGYVVEPVSSAKTWLEVAATGSRGTDLSVEPFRSRIMKASFGGSTTLRFDGRGTPTSGGHVVVYNGDWAALLRVAAETAESRLTMFRVSFPPAAVLSVTGPMDVVTRTTNPTATRPELDAVAEDAKGIDLSAVEVLTPGSGEVVEIDKSSPTDK